MTVRANVELDDVRQAQQGFVTRTVDEVVQGDGEADAAQFTDAGDELRIDGQILKYFDRVGGDQTAAARRSIGG